MRELGIAILLVVCGVFVRELTAADGPLRMTVLGRVGFSPADVIVRLHVEPGGLQREVLLELDGPLYRSSIFPIRSDPTAPTVQDPARYGSIPQGEYIVRATLTDKRCHGCSSRVVLARRETTVDIREGVPRSAR
jgi:hypothetical protein